MGMGAMLTHTEHGFGSIANILLIIGAGGTFNAILKTSGLAETLAHILSNLHMHPILLAAGGTGAARRRRFGNGSDDGCHGDSGADAAALPERKPGDHHHCHRVRRYWLHDRDRFSLLAGEAILRRDPERDLQILYDGDVYRLGACTWQHIPAFFHYLSAKRRIMENATITTLTAQFPLVEDLIALKETTA